MLLKHWRNVVDFEGLKELSADLVSIDVEDTFVSNNSELNEAFLLPTSNIGVDLKGVDRIGTFDEAASDNKATLKVPDRQIIFTMHAERDQVLPIIREGQGLDSSLMEGVPVQ